MNSDLFITQMLDRKQMSELIYIFNKKARPIKKEDK